MSEPDAPLLPVEDFPDPDDAFLFPRLSERQLEQVARFAERRRFEPGDVLFEQGQRDAPFYVLEEGSVDFFDRRPAGDRYFAKAKAGTFIGDTSIFTGEPTIAACLAAEPCRILAMDRPTLQRMVAQFPEVGDLLLRTMMARRAWLEDHDYGTLQLIGSRWSQETFRLRDFLNRNQVPFRWFAPEGDEESRGLLEQLRVPDEEMPVLIVAGRVLRRPTVAKVADALGLLPMLRGLVDEPYDLIVVGAGPAGLAAAVYGASEGLATLVLDADSPGGQAGTSSKIENYLGFATGISGGELARQAVLQARKFGAVLSNPRPVVALHCEGNFKELELEDGVRVRARTVVLATGAEYRKLDAENLGRFEGSGVYYAAGTPEALQCREEDVLIVGGGNSAGQAAMFMSEHARRVYLVIRGDALTKSMSQYLVNRIEQSPAIEVLTRSQVTAVHGDDKLEAVTLTRPDGKRQVPVSAIFTMIGAVPRTAWLAANDCVALDKNGFMLTGSSSHRVSGTGGAFKQRWPLEREPFFLETTQPGVFAVGDVRAGSVKRVASAVGEGSMAVALVHEVLAEEKQSHRR